jgi:glycerol-3-phosphate acyltransferase PlsY
MTFDPMLLVLFAGAYLLGAVPFGLLVARSAGDDVRETGSGNIGATNVARTAGKPLGVLTLVLDALKGAAPVLVADHVLHAPNWALVVAGLVAVLAHMFPIYLSFRGGKGVATALGVFLALTPASAGVAVLVFAVVVAPFRVVSIGSLTASVALTTATVWLDGRPEVIGLAGAVTVLVFIRHAGNIRRLLKRTEPEI